MRITGWSALGCAAVFAVLAADRPSATAAKLTVTLSNAQSVKLVGAFRRWNEDGNPRKKVNQKAKIEVPEVDFVATRGERGQWVFQNLAPGRWDLVIMAGDHVRIEGFDYPPVLEFDPFLSRETPVDEETRDWIFNDIKKSQHYENKVVPLYIASDKENKTLRVLVMLIRDKITSYEADMPGAATIRHEVWQYTNNYGGFAKERRTRVIDRSILPRGDLKKWTWLWDPTLGGIVVKDAPLRIEYTVPRASSEKKLQGLYPY
jgi:hypothetical protein